jgi:hypothetical protein
VIFGVLTAIAGLAVTFYAIPPVSWIAMLVFALGVVLTYGGVRLMLDSRQG